MLLRDEVCGLNLIGIRRWVLTKDQVFGYNRGGPFHVPNHSIQAKISFVSRDVPGEKRCGNGPCWG